MKKAKKLLSVILMFSLVLSIGLTACTKTPLEEPTNPVVPDSYKETIDIDLYDDLTIATGLSNVTWTTSDATLVTVTDGMIIALKEGDAVITATSGSQTEKYKVLVKDNGKRPSVVINSSLTLMSGDTGTISAHISFNNKLYYPTFAFGSDDTEVLAINSSSGEYTAGKGGSTNINASTQWRNVGAVHLTESVSVEVVLDLTINPSKTSLDLFSSARVLEQDFVAEDTITLTVRSQTENIDVENGDIVASGYDADVITVASSNGYDFVVTAKKAGVTQIKFDYVTEQAEETISIGVNVALATVTHTPSAEVLFDRQSLEEHSAVLDTLFVDGYTEITDVTTLDTSVIYEDGAFVAPAYGKRTWLVTDGVKGYRIPVTCASLIIEDEDDFLGMYQTLDSKITKEGPAAAPTKVNVKFSGYVVFVENLDFTDMNIEAYKVCYYDTRDNRRGFSYASYFDDLKNYTSGYNANSGTLDYGFNGVFDGRGKTVKGLRIGGKGLFPALAQGSTIKNISFTEVSLSMDAIGLVDFNSGTIDNVFIDIKSSDTTNAAGICNHMNSDGIISNSLVYFPGIASNSAATTRFGVFARNYNDGAVVENAYGIGNSSSYLFGNKTTQDTANHFASVTAFDSATKDYTGFNADYWDFDTYKIPVFKTYSSTTIGLKD